MLKKKAKDGIKSRKEVVEEIGHKLVEGGIDPDKLVELSKKPSIRKLTEELSAEVEIIPLRDFPQGIHQNEINIDNIKEGVPVTIPRRFLRNLVTEKVIKNIPK